MIYRFIRKCFFTAMIFFSYNVLMSRTNEARHIKWHKTCKYRCRLDSSICNNKQRWNNDK